MVSKNRIQQIRGHHPAQKGRHRIQTPRTNEVPMQGTAVRTKHLTSEQLWPISLLLNCKFSNYIQTGRIQGAGTAIDSRSKVPIREMKC